MLTDDDCRAIREAIGQPAMSFDRVRAMILAINAMPDGPVWVVPREASEEAAHFGKTFFPNSQRGRYQNARVMYRDMNEIAAAELTEAGAAEVGEG